MPGGVFTSQSYVAASSDSPRDPEDERVRLRGRGERAVEGGEVQDAPVCGLEVHEEAGDEDRREAVCDGPGQKERWHVFCGEVWEWGRTARRIG